MTIKTFFLKLVNCRRGEDLTEGSSALSKMGKVTLAALAVSGAAATVVMSQNAATDSENKTATDITKVTSAPAPQAPEALQTPFKK